MLRYVQILDIYGYAGSLLSEWAAHCSRFFVAGIGSGGKPSSCGPRA